MIPAVLPTYARADVAFERGEGAYLYDAEGREFLDFGSGIAVTMLGHCHPHLVQALVEQAGKLWHTSNLYRIEGQERLAERLVRHSFADTVFFANSGAEAVECALKMVRAYHHHAGRPERHRVIAFQGSFHGRTLATLAAAGNPKYLKGFAPAVPGFDQVPFGDLAAVRAAIGPETAAVLVEPVQGEGGIRVAPPGFLAGLRALCDEHGLLLALDEVQSGMGRTGRLFAHEWSGIRPDVVAVAKALGGGFPMAACLATERAAGGMGLGSHASTYGGNPLAVAVGNAVLDVVLEAGFLERVRDLGNYLTQQLSMVVERHPKVIGGVRGTGLMLGLEARVPNTDLITALMRQRLITVAAGDNVVRLSPPLIVSERQIGEAVDKLDTACAELAG